MTTSAIRTTLELATVVETTPSIKVRPYGSNTVLPVFTEHIKGLSINDEVMVGFDEAGRLIVFATLGGNIPDVGDVIGPGAIERNMILDEAIDRTKIAQGEVTEALIAVGAITGTKIGTAAIESFHIAANTIQGYHLVAGSISADRIAAYSITANEISAQTITANEISANTITAGNIEAGTLTSASGVFGDISADDITTGTLSAAQISVGSGNSVFKVGQGADLGWIWSGHVSRTSAPFTVSPTGNLTVANASITGGSVAGSTVTGTLTAATINATSINAGTLNAGVIYSGTIAANKVTAGTLGAGVIYAGTISANSVTAGTLTGSTLQTATSGKRIVVSSAAHAITWYDGSDSGNIVQDGQVFKMQSSAGYLWFGEFGAASLHGGSQNTISSGSSKIVINSGTGVIELYDRLYATNLASSTTTVGRNDVWWDPANGNIFWYNDTSSELTKNNIRRHDLLANIDVIPKLGHLFYYKEGVGVPGEEEIEHYGLIGERAAELSPWLVKDSLAPDDRSLLIALWDRVADLEAQVYGAVPTVGVSTAPVETTYLTTLREPWVDPNGHRPEPPVPMHLR